MAAPAFQCAPKPIANARSRAAKSGMPSSGSDVLVDDRAGVVDRDLLDLDAALRGADEHQAAGGAVEHDRQVVLLHDLGRGPDEHAPDREPLDLEREDLRRDVLRLVRGGGELHAAGLAAAARRAPGP